MAAAGGAGKKRPADEPARDWEKTLEPVRKLAAVLKSVRRELPRFSFFRAVFLRPRACYRALTLRLLAVAPVLSCGAQDPIEKKKPSDLGYDNLFEVRPRTRSVPRACCAMVPGVYPAR